MLVTMNISYDNGDGGFVIYESSASDEYEILSVFEKNISYKNRREVSDDGGATYTHTGNTWDMDVTVDDSWFISVDSTNWQNSDFLKPTEATISLMGW